MPNGTETGYYSSNRSRGRQLLPGTAFEVLCNTEHPVKPLHKYSNRYVLMALKFINIISNFANKTMYIEANFKKILY